ncbi:MAG: 50S ribosomal protein L25 [Parcubacteria group bacterium]|nr:50S ribosomal protein L25 [Parcubacteria group bacterium]
MQTLELKAEKRDILGRKVNKLRKTGKIPAVFYGRKEKSTPVFIEATDFGRVLNMDGESSIIRLVFNDGGNKDVLIQDISRDPVRGQPTHVDFYAIEADRAVEVKVPIEFTGESVAVKELGGTLVKVLYELEVRGLPKDLPQEIVVDIAPLATLESRIAARDIALPAGIELVTGPEEIIAAIAVAKEEEVAPAEFDASKIEVEEKGKKEEEEIPGEEAPKEKKQEKK